ncbi:MAG: hypothetical protein IJ328_01340, partial [Muribaculaceae bacterium]|nr:hypothetical protein [Muribaculaceae bacterium]
FVFWAQPANAAAFTVSDMRHIKVSYEKATSNDELRDAFYAAVNSYKVTGSVDMDVTLYRPFAQINFGTADWAEAVSAGIGTVQTQVAVQGVYTQLNTYYGSVEGETTATFAFANIPSGDNETLKCDADNDGTNEEYRWLSMNYVLVPAEKMMSNGVAMDVKSETVYNNIPVANVPMQRNYRTNIVGNLLTSGAVFNVVINPIYNEPDYNVTQWDGTVADDVQPNAEGVYEIKTPAQLAWVAEQVDGGNTFDRKTVKLVSDLHLDNKPWNPIGDVYHDFCGTFDGNGHAIYNLYVDLTGAPAYQTAGLFASISGYATIKNFTIENAVVKNLNTGSACGTAVVVGSSRFSVHGNVEVEDVTVKNAVVEGNHYVGGIVGYHRGGDISGCKVEGIQLTATPDDLDKNGVYDNGDKVGGIVGFQGSLYSISNCTVNNFAIKGYRELGGIVGEFSSVGSLVINKATNGTVTIDQTITSYNEFPKAANAGEIVGRQLDGKARGNVAENVEVKQIVVSKESLQSALDNMAEVGNYILTFANNITGDVTVTEKKDVKVVIDGDKKKYDGTINIYGNSGDQNAELVVKNVNFETSTNGEVFVYGFNTGTSDYSRYPDAVTVEDCTFTAKGEAVHTAVGVKLASGQGDFNIISCTATNMHSLAQFQSHEKAAIIDGAELNGCKNGVSFGNTAEAVLKNSTINSEAYGVRGDGDGRNCNLTVTNTTINSKLPIVARKMTNADYTYAVKLETTNLGGAENYHVVFTKGSDDVDPVAPVGKWSIEGANDFKVYPRDEN